MFSEKYRVLRTGAFAAAASAVFAALAVTGCGGGGSSTASSGSAPGGPRGVVVQLQPGADIASIEQQYGCQVEESDPTNNLYVLVPRSGSDQNALADSLHQDTHLVSAQVDPGVQTPETGETVTGNPIHVAFDFVRAGTARFSALSAAYSSATVTDTADFAADQQVDIGTVRSTVTGSGVTVAVLDTGAMESHPILASHLVAGYNAINPGAAPEDVADGTQNNVVGHGTMVAGIIARLAPGASIMPVRVLNGEGNGSVFNLVRGLRWAVMHGARVINLSLGSATDSPALQYAIEDARHNGVIVVASAGNAGTETLEYPAAYDGVLATASVEANDTKSTYSNYGPQIRLDAPGSNIVSTYTNGGYATWSGTSFAAPYVTAAAVLALSAHPTTSISGGDPEQLASTARSIDAVNPGYAGLLGSGVVDIQKAVMASGSSSGIDGSGGTSGGRGGTGSGRR